MDKKIIRAIQDHELWVRTLGKKGEKIVFENIIIEYLDKPKINLSQGSLIECTLKKMSIENWDFYSSMLCSTTFYELSMNSCVFVNANLVYSQFYNTEIRLTNFSKADLSDGIFENVEIENSKFINTLLVNNIFKNVHLRNVDFSGALIENLFFDELSTLENIRGLNEAHIKSINIGTPEHAICLREYDALQWIKNKIIT